MTERSAKEYHEDLEDSIRRCEELLTFAPVTFLPPRRSSYPKERKLSEKEDMNLGILGIPDAEWHKNMELLSRVTDIDSAQDKDVSQEIDLEELPAYHRTVSNLKNLDKELTTKPGYLTDTEWSQTSGGISFDLLSSDAIQTDSKAIARKNSRIQSSTEDTLCTCEEEVSGRQETVTIELGDQGPDNGKQMRETVSVSYVAPDSKTERPVPGDEVDIVIESNARPHSTPHLKFSPLDDKPRKHQRSKSVPKERLQLTETKEFFSAIAEVMNNLKSYIHLPELSTAPNSSDTGMDRLKKLSKPRTEVYKRLAEVKEILEEKQLKACSFKPAVGRKPEPENTVPFLQRVTEIQQQKEIRKRARRVMEKEELDACSFRPKINSKSPYRDRNSIPQPLQERFKELERRRRERIEKAAKEKDSDYTFKPEINPKSIELFKQKGLESVDLAERLILKSSVQSVHLDCKNEIELKRQTKFSPEINSNTDDIIACSRQFGGHSTDFFARQQQFLQMLEEKRKLKENKIPSEYTFTPNIGNSAYILKQSMCREIFPETVDDRVERLVYKDKAKQVGTRKKVAEEYYAQFNFHPEIDEVSRIVGRSSSVKDLYANKKGQELKKELEQAANEEFQQKCPFRPLIRTSLAENENIKFRSNLLERLQGRKDPSAVARQHEELRTLRELEEIKECTFKPTVKHNRVKDCGAVVIKGLDRHLELQHIAKQMKKDQEEYEKKVFFSQVSALPIRQYTIPKPFSFGA